MSEPTACSQSEAIRHSFAEVNGVRLHYASTGAGRLIVFLHGFPEFWYAWKDQLTHFGRDFLAVAPDLRGYNLSSKPADVDSELSVTQAHKVGLRNLRHIRRQLCRNRLTQRGACQSASPSASTIRTLQITQPRKSPSDRIDHLGITSTLDEADR